MVEIEYLKMLEPELRTAIENGEPDRAASFAKELARLKRKSKRISENSVAKARTQQS